MAAHKRHGLARLFPTFLALRLTPAGWAWVLLWIVSAFQGGASLDLPIYYVWSFLTAMWGSAWLLSLIAVPKLRLTRLNLTHTSAGDILRGSAVVFIFLRRP